MREIVGFRAGIIAMALILGGCDSAAPKPDHGAAEPTKLPQPVMVVPVRFEEGARTRTFAATIRPSIESDLGFRISGKVARRLVRTGDFVRSGQPLLTLDTNDLRLQREQAEAEVKAAQSNLIQAEADEGRATDLQSKGWMANAALQKAHATAEEARSRLVRAQRALDLAGHALDFSLVVCYDPRAAVISATIASAAALGSGASSTGRPTTR
jgi:multidrug efflux pump subunit AcrA (membrane-fusion protein)